MSNEEALQILSEHDRIRVNIINANDAETVRYNNASVEALRMAIAALKAQSCEDAVSREAMLNGLASIAKAKARSDAQKALMGRVMFFTEQLPPVTPKQRTGEIIMGGYDCDHYICSECGEDFGWYSKPNHKYCPNCGAKLEGESE